MKDEEVTILVRRIRQVLEELRRVLDRTQEGWERSRRSNDDYYLDGVALNLHGFYSGIERLFTHIAETIDGDLPHGEDWHRRLLQQMKTEVPSVRMNQKIIRDGWNNRPGWFFVKSGRNISLRKSSGIRPIRASAGTDT